MKIYGIVEETETQKDDSACIIEALEEDDYNMGSEFICSNMRGECIVSALNKQYYSPLALRTRIMTNTEYYYCQKNQGCIDMVISVNPNIGNTNVVNISNVIFSDKMDLNHVVDSMKKIMKHIEKNMLKKVTKFRISYLGDEKREPDFIKGIKKAGFVLEATLNNETENLYMFCLEQV